MDFQKIEKIRKKIRFREGIGKYLKELEKKIKKGSRVFRKIKRRRFKQIKKVSIP